MRLLFTTCGCDGSTVNIHLQAVAEAAGESGDDSGAAAVLAGTYTTAGAPPLPTYYMITYYIAHLLYYGR